MPPQSQVRSVKSPALLKIFKLVFQEAAICIVPLAAAIPQNFAPEIFFSWWQDYKSRSGKRALNPGISLNNALVAKRRIENLSEVNFHDIKLEIRLRS
ncbi:hypothetical protein Zmor_010150 [Zophobas morio]|uniref:Uncharacterized protein n=1 Tax=Zophobas morio TaxID=2755281 RepID=A0AA38IJX1_9CUCU|nr:hypothetical protein Zmor_010150 [Zophobas morio]